MAVACASSLAGGWEMGPGLALGALFTEAELAVADHLVQLSGSGGGEETEAESESPRSVNTTCAATAWEEQREEEVVAGAGLGIETTTMELEELDRRARKRYRLLSDVYAATRPVSTGADAGSNAPRKRKRGHEADQPEAKTSTTIRYDGDQCF